MLVFNIILALLAVGMISVVITYNLIIYLVSNIQKLEDDEGYLTAVYSELCNALNSLNQCKTNILSLLITVINFAILGIPSVLSLISLSRQLSIKLSKIKYHN